MHASITQLKTLHLILEYLLELTRGKAENEKKKKT
jgi:hypothetical protein